MHRLTGIRSPVKEIGVGQYAERSRRCCDDGGEVLPEACAVEHVGGGVLVFLRHEQVKSWRTWRTQLDQGVDSNMKVIFAN